MSRAALQGLLIYSPDRTAFLLAYYTGKLLLVNTASYTNDPYLQNAKTVIWSSATSGSPTPMNLVMQEVRSQLCLLGRAYPKPQLLLPAAAVGPVAAGQYAWEAKAASMPTTMQGPLDAVLLVAT